MKHVSARAPTRIDFVGGWTDVQPFCDKEPGLVVNAAVGVSARVDVRDAGRTVRHADAFIQAACDRFNLDRVSVQLESDAPLGAGLGGSGAVGVALVGALATYAGAELTPRAVAELAHRIEVEDLHIIGGKQDQYAAAFGGFLALTFLADSVEIEQLQLSQAGFRELHRRSVVVYTGQSRVSGDIHARVQAAFLARNPDTFAALATIRRVAREFRNALLVGNIALLGPLLNENWDAQKRLHPSTTNERVDEFFRIARQNGAVGGKALGAGGGGCLYFLVEEGRRDDLSSALEDAGGEILDAPFTARGLEITLSPSNAL